MREGVQVMSLAILQGDQSAGAALSQPNVAAVIGAWYHDRNYIPVEGLHGLGDV